MTDSASRAVPVDGVLGRAVHAAAVAFALVGSIILAAMTVMSTVSIVGRWLFAQPIPGDYEVAQLGTAIAVASFLPYCALRGGHVLVDFLTANAPPRLRAALDVLGSLTIAAVGLLVGWRLALGMLDLRQYGETTMVLAIPTWYAYAPMVPSFVLLGIVALHRAAMLFRVVRGADRR